MKKFLVNQGGATAVEFAMVLPAFVALVFMTIEIGLVVYGKSMADRAARDAANALRVNGGLADADLRKAVCNAAAPVLSCDDALKVSKQLVLSAADTSGQVSIQTVQIEYRWPVYFPTTVAFLADAGKEYRTLRAVGVSSADADGDVTGGLVW
jgi:Flp pilus assembly protein TadG